MQKCYLCYFKIHISINTIVIQQPIQLPHCQIHVSRDPKKNSKPFQNILDRQYRNKLIKICFYDIKDPRQK